MGRKQPLEVDFLGGCVLEFDDVRVLLDWAVVLSDGLDRCCHDEGRTDDMWGELVDERQDRVRRRSVSTKCRPFYTRDCISTQVERDLDH